MRGVRNGALIVTVPRGPACEAAPKRESRPKRPARPCVADMERRRLRRVRVGNAVLAAIGGGAALYAFGFAACLG